MKKIKDYIFYGIIVAFVVIFLASAIIFKVYNIEILPSQFYGALIGVFITAIVTAFLLRGQTEGDEKREKSVKVFEEKLKIYKDFLSKLQEIVKNGVIYEVDVKELIFQISYIAMHTSSERVNEILEKLKITITEIGNNDENKYEKFAENILNVMLELQIALYGEKLGKDSIDTEKFNDLITKIEEKMPSQKIVEYFRKNPIGKPIMEKNEKTIRFYLENIATDKLQVTITSAEKGYWGIRALEQGTKLDWNSNLTYKEKYIEELKKYGLKDGNTWLGLKFFKQYSAKNEEDLANKIKEDIETFIKNIK